MANITRLLNLCFAVLLAVSGQVSAEGSEPAGDRATLPIEELRVFAEVFSRIKKDYVEPVDDRQLLRDAIRGMLSGLDPHSAYLDEDEFNELRVGTSGEFGGLGIEVGMEDGFVKVIAPIDDTPADRAGIEAGDLIIRIDEHAVKGLSLDEAVKIMRGKPGTIVELQILREGRDAPLKVTVERAIIKTVSVKSRMLEPGFAYVRLSQFQSRSTDDLLRMVEKIKDEAAGELKGLILDLRNNPGGVLQAAVGVADAFLDSGAIVYTEGRVDDSQLNFEASPDDVLQGAPLVVLVNGGSASASEIVAGALQDHRRAVIMGQETFGKGSVQSIVPVNQKTAIKLTTARYFTPNGRSIQAEGIVPDIILPNLKLARAEGEDSTLKEAQLVHHLDNPNGEQIKPPVDSGKKDGEKDKAEEKLSLAQKDYALSEALNLLKGLAILREREGT